MTTGVEVAAARAHICRMAGGRAMCLVAVAGCSASTAVVPSLPAGSPTPGDGRIELHAAAVPVPGLDRLSGAAGSVPVGADLLAPVDVADFRQRFGDSAGLAVVGLDGSAAQFVGDLRTPYAWSTSKVLVVATVLQELGGVAGLSDDQRELVTAALSASDNESAALLMAELEARHGDLDGALAALTAMLRSAGDTATTAAATDDYSTGETVWTLTEQARFVSALRRGCLLDRDSTGYLLAEMGGVIDEQSWGLGDVGSPAYKGGWDVDEKDLLYVRQVGLLRAADGRDYIVALSARTPIPAVPAAEDDLAAAFDQEWTDGEWPSAAGFDYSFTGSEDLAGEVARWVRQRVTAAPAPAPC